MDNNTSSDDDRQTPSNGQNSSDNDSQTSSNSENASDDDVSSVSTETLLPSHLNDQREISQMSETRVCSVNVNHRINLPNYNIKHPNRPDDDGVDPFNDAKRIIIDAHVKVSHINRVTLRCLTTDIPTLQLDKFSNRKSTGTTIVSRGNHILSRSTNSNRNNREITQGTSRQSTVHISRISTAANINQDSNQKVIGQKPTITRVSLVNGLPLIHEQNDTIHVSVQRAPRNSKK